MISKIEGNKYIKNFFLINSKYIFELLDLLKSYTSPFLNDGLFMIYHQNLFINTNHFVN